MISSLTSLAWLDHDDGRTDFCGQDICSSLLALYIALRAGLEDPRWAFLTVLHSIATGQRTRSR